MDKVTSYKELRAAEKAIKGKDVPVETTLSFLLALRFNSSGRDDFARAALQGLMANSGGPIQANGTNGWNWVNCSPKDVANLCWTVADEMLAERGDDMQGDQS